MLLFVLANLLPYYGRTFMPGAADALNRIGFPFMFWEEGGFSYTHRFIRLAFWSDVAIAAFFSILGGVLFVRSVR